MSKVYGFLLLILMDLEPWRKNIALEEWKEKEIITPDEQKCLK
ncbi:hypothetical protein [Polycladospora coralii]|nr:hypothetical protein [Polycladospora coralii]